MSTSREHKSFFRLNEKVDGPQIVFMPMRDGTVFYAQSIAKVLGAEFGCCGVRLSSETLAASRTLSIYDIAESFAKDVDGQCPSNKIYLFGYSFGGLLAFETGRALARLGKRVERVWIGDTDVRRFATIPVLFMLNPRSEALQLLRYLKYNWWFLIGFKKAPNIVRSYRFRYPFDVNVDPDHYRSITKLLVHAVSGYSPAPWRGAPLVLLRATDGDQGVRDLGWCRLVGEEMRIVNIEAGHGNMTQLPRPVMQIATAIKVGILETS